MRSRLSLFFSITLLSLCFWMQEVTAMGFDRKAGQNTNSSTSDPASAGGTNRRRARTSNRRGRRALAENGPFQSDDFKAVANEIKVVRPAIDNVALKCDKMVINTALPEIQQVYVSSGLTEEVAKEAALVAWKEVRLSSPLQTDKCMASSSFIAFTLTYGRMIFRSNPSDANLIVNDNALPEKTTHSRLYPSGTYRVRFSKTGYETVEKVCAVLARDEIVCQAELNPKP